MPHNLVTTWVKAIMPNGIKSRRSSSKAKDSAEKSLEKNAGQSDNNDNMEIRGPFGFQSGFFLATSADHRICIGRSKVTRKIPLCW